MNFMTIEGRDIQIENIATVETRKCGITENNQYEVILTMNNGQLIQAFKGTKPACDDFRVAFKTGIGAVDKPYPSVNWVDFEPNTVTVERGKVTHAHMLWNGAEAESTAFTYEQGDIHIAEFALGEVLGIGVGETTIAANKDGKKGTGKARVVASKDGIMFEHDGASLPVGGSLQNPLKNNGVNVNYNSIVFHSSNPAVATVDNRGTADVVGVGVTFIIADYNGQRYGYSIHGTAAARVASAANVEEEVKPAPKKRSASTKKKAE
ncbi:MAG: hypothetical protein ACRCX2_07120 [Paraclostridium sp.]